jgi:hypothetical protein
LDKALRRQLGATNIDLDTLTGWAQFTLDEPERITFDALEETAWAASYTIKEVRLDITGRVVAGRCATCEADVMHVKVDGTGQLLEVTGEVQEGEHLRFVMRTESWLIKKDGEHAVFEVLRTIPLAE